MSAEKSQQKISERREGERESAKIKGSYTQEGFYRKGNHNLPMGLSNLSQKQSVYDVKIHPAPLNSVSEVGYTTLNPKQYNPSDVIEEQQYQVLAVFELNRERQKNRILQKRLMNKQIHIAKMKEVHNELTEAFEKCQEQLQYFKRKCSQPVDVREYVEEINQLKHLVIRLEDKITEYEKKESKRYSSVKQNQGGNSQQNNRNISNFKANFSQGKQKRDKRSKTVANQQDSSPQFKKLNMIEEYVVQYPNRITNFISQFMAMVECFNAESQAARKSLDKNNVKRRLKIGWKWIKEVVVEWNQNKNYIQKVQFFHSRLRKIFNISDDKDDSEIMDTIMAAISN